MTVRQKRLLNEVDKCIKNNKPIKLKELGRKAGYAKKSNKIYAKGIKRYIIERLKQLGTDEKSIIEGFNLSREMALKNYDLTNFNRANEDLARINGQFKDKSEITGTQKLIISDEEQKEFNRLRGNIFQEAPTEN